jgi:sugar (glycoside-pentoside-hexuronide) transporter
MVDLFKLILLGKMRGDHMEKLKLREKLGFATGVFGQNILYGIMTSYLLIYYTDVALLPLAATGTLFAIARLWDAINDPMMGVLADKTRTRWGRFRPYLLFAPIPLALVTIAVFSIPDIAMPGKVLFAYITYILWGMVYTLCDTPIWSLTSVMTNDSNQKTGLISLITIFGFIGIIGVSVAFVPMLQVFGGTGSSFAFQKTVTIFSCIAGAAMMFIFFSTKERVEPAKKMITVKESLGALIHNKPLMLILISFVITSSITTIMQSIALFFAQYNLGDAGLISMLTMVMFIPLVVGSALTAVISKKLGKKRTLIVSAILRAIILFAFYITGYSNLTAVFIFYALNGLLIGMSTILLTSMIADCVVYSEWKMGIRADGLSFSMRTFVAKISGAIGGGLSAVILAAYGYTANQPISDFTQKGIFNIISLFPAIAALAGVIPIFFYTLTQSKVEEMTGEIEMRKALIAKQD